MYPSAALLLVDDKARSAVIELARSRELVNVARIYEATRSNLRGTFEALRADAEAKVFRVLLLETLDLPGVGTRRLLSELSALAELNVELGSVQEPFLTLKGDQADLVRWLHARMSAERSRNVAEGIARSSKRPGRPRAHIPEAEVLRMAAKGLSLRAIARQTGVSPSVLQRFLAAHKAKQTHQETPASECRE